MADGTLSIFGIAGSLRSGSYNRALLRAAVEVAPPEVELSTCDISGIPMFDEDVEAKGDPAPVGNLKTDIRMADGVLIATPEYQHGVPGVLKNALDWASRPPGESVLKGKPVGILGASPGVAGTSRAQIQLREILAYNQAETMLSMELLVNNAAERFDEDLVLTDEESLGFLEQFVGLFVEHCRAVSPG